MLSQASDSWTLQEAAHLLNRAGFGGSPDEIKAFHAHGRHRAVGLLFTTTDAPDAFPAPAWASEERMLADNREFLRQRRETMLATRGLDPADAEQKRREIFQRLAQDYRLHTLEAQNWWFHRMAATRAPLQEKMTLFWHDHFATSIQKVRQPALMLKQNGLFRDHALGSFKALVQAILTDPAMLLYLDTQNSRKGRPNENFAREVMELVTLGEGNYTERDIREAARAFTGYELQRLTGKVRHEKHRWDDSPKTIFGKTGNFNGQDVIDLIFEKPEPAAFIARKLWQFFVQDDPSPKVVEALAVTMLNGGYHVEPMLREIFLSQEFYSSEVIRSQIKSPVQFTIQLIKQLEIDQPPAGFAMMAQQQLGQVLFMPPNVAGWDWGKAWINTHTLLARYNLAGILTKGAEDTAPASGRMRPPGSARAFRGWRGPDYETIAPRELRERPAELVDSLIFRFFQGPLPEKARGSFIEYAAAKRGLVFTNKEIAELCHLMLSTPHYQLC